MASFFRRNKSDARPERRYSIEELAAAFPSAAPAAPSLPDADVRPAETPEIFEHDAPGASPLSSPTAAPHAAPATAAEPARDEAFPTIGAPRVGAAKPGAPVEFPSSEIAPPLAVYPPPTPLHVLDDALVDQRRGEAVPTAPELPAADTALPAPAGKPGWRERLRSTMFARSFGSLFSRNPKLDDDLLDEIETALLTADVGVPATNALIEDLRRRMKSRQFADARALLTALRADLIALLRPVAKPLQIDMAAKPFVLLVVGVNGVGKTTTIGKLARRYRDENHSLMLAAGDTFRAAAVAQLQAWGDRNDVPVVAQGHNTLGKGGDAASVAFDALQAAKARGTQVLIADTAGRLHTQHGLMAELGKIKRVISKVDASAPHEVLMVIDGTTGQNAISQLRQFHAAVGVTGLVVTKLDGSAKGGVVFALAREFGIPIRYAGIGERPEDLRVFDAEAFVDALLPETLGA